MSINELRKRIRNRKEKCSKCDNTACAIHHKNGDHTDDRFENLAPICQRCHDEIHGITPQMSEMGALIRSYWDIQKFREIY